MFDFFTSLNATTTLEAIADWAGPLFTALLVPALVGLGILIGGSAVLYIVTMISRGVNKLLRVKRTRRGYRRR